MANETPSPAPVDAPSRKTPRRPGQPGADGERREDPMPDRPSPTAPYPRDADGPQGT